MGSQLNRRAILGAAAALPAVASASPVVAAPSDAGQFLAWERELQAYWEKAEHPDASDEVTDYWTDRAADVEALIHATPGHSREAILVKARLLRTFRKYDLDPRGVETVDQIIAHLAGATPPAVAGRWKPDGAPPMWTYGEGGWTTTARP